MTKQFKKEDRYLVVKRSDTERLLTNWERDEMYRLARMVCDGRHHLGKPPLECVVVEHDWSIYDDVWKMVEAIATNQPTELDQLRRERDELLERQSSIYEFSSQIPLHLTDDKSHANEHILHFVGCIKKLSELNRQGE